LGVLVLTAFAYASPVTFTFKNVGGIGETNIEFGHPQQGPALRITGHEVAHGQAVNFTSTTDITAKGGQSDIDPCNSGHSCPNGEITSLTVSVAGKGGTGTGFFEDLILDPQTLVASGDLLAKVVTNQGTFTSGLFGNHMTGENFLTIQATGVGTEIESVTLTSTAGFGALKQPRISGVNGLVVPEPSSLLLLGSGLIGLAGIVGRKRRA